MLHSNIFSRVKRELTHQTRLWRIARQKMLRQVFTIFFASSRQICITANSAQHIKFGLSMLKNVMIKEEVRIFM